MTLAELKPRHRYRIDAIDTADPAVQRLMILGLVEGAEIELASAAIGGDPIEFRLFGASLSLRREHAVRFRVTPLE
ncbi:MAG: FeoA domain-containing protein [Woeseiaceae bacterium]|nr:FeoA domain-containing protein [Woeseiaceae bacterium]